MLDIKPHNYLFSEEEIKSRKDCQEDELHGEEKVLNSMVVEEAFNKILNDYKPKHKNIIFSLCTSTRPYLKSIKWKTFYKYFGDSCDLVICSNGGIIPIEYMYCFPFMEYDAHRESSKTDELYKNKMKERLTKFLTVFGNNYEKIIYTFLPSSRNAEAIKEMGKESRGILLPTMEVYNDIRKNGYPGVNTLRYPQCAGQALKEMASYLNIEIDLNKNEQKQTKKKNLF